MTDRLQTQPYAEDTDCLRARIVANTRKHQFLGAGAGAGKTTVLVDHYFHLLKRGFRPAQLVAVTFTEKAAAEMKARLRDKCRERAEQARRALQVAPPNERAEAEAAVTRWETVLHELEGAPISTIHGLCSRLLREHSLLAAIDPDFTVLDEVDAQLLLDQVVRQTLVSRLDDPDGTAGELVVALGYGNAVSALCGLVQDSVKLALVLQDSRYSEGAEQVLAAWQEACEKILPPLVRQLLESEVLVDNLRVLRACTCSNSKCPIGTRRQDVLAIADELGVWEGDCWRPRCDTSAEAQRCLEALSRLAKVSTPQQRWGKDADWGGDVDTPREALRALVMSDGPFVRLLGPLQSLGQSDEALDRDCAAITRALVVETRIALEGYEAAKTEASALDFEDLMQLTARLWEQQPRLAEAVSSSLAHVMIDEFQDTNTLQKQVLWPLVTGTAYDPAAATPLPATGPRLFIVGDAKQSIYRFRDADVAVFNTTRLELAAAGARDDELTRNFRSTASLIEVYNRFFSDPAVMGAAGGAKSFRPYEASYAAMKATREDPEPWQTPLEIRVAMENRTTAGDDEASGDEEAGLRRLRALEGEWIAARIAHLLSDPQFRVRRREGGEFRWQTARPGDIAILLRSMRDVSLYEQALREADLPYYLVVGQGFFAAQEVQDLVGALSAIENGLDDIALVGALRSPLFGLSDETLYWLGALGPGPWWWRVQSARRAPDRPEHRAALAHLEPEQKALLDRAAELLENLRRSKNRLSLPELLQALVDRTGYTAALAGLFGGRQKVSNVRKLVELAGQFEVEHQALGRGGLRDFAEHLKRLTAEEVREGQAPVEEEAGNSIKLITYHSAKGLQWPIVIAADLCRQSGGGFDPPYHFHPQAGLTLKTTRLQQETGGDGSYWPPAGRLAKRLNGDEAKAEDCRLFYVAATRAQDLLILSGVTELSISSDEKRAGAVSSPAAAGPLGWINTALPESLWQARGNTPGANHQQWQEGVLLPCELPDATGAPPPDAETENLLFATAEQLAALPARLAEVTAVRDGQERFTATDLSLYGHCPRLYELQRRLGLPGVLPSLGRGAQAGELSALDFGTVVHRVLQLLGSGGRRGLDDLVPEGATMLHLDPLLDKRAAAAGDRIRSRVSQFLDTPLYRELFTADCNLRSEAGLTVALPVDGRSVLIEGKIDALVEKEGAVHLLDYKTAEHDERHHDQYAVQLGLYCYAVEQATGALPASAALVYLSGDRADIRSLEVPAAAQHAVAAATAAVRGIWAGDFEVRAEDCGYCVGQRICRPGSEPPEEIGEEE